MNNLVTSPISQIEKIVRKICGQFLTGPHTETLMDIAKGYIAAFEKKHFLTLASYGKKSEKTYRRFFDKHMDIPWCQINKEMAKAILGEEALKGLLAIAVDASYIRKSGWCTSGAGNFYSGVEGMAKHGLELLGLGLVCPAKQVCVGLTAIQSPDKVALDHFSDEELTLIDWYIQVIRVHSKELLKLSTNIVGDAAYSCKKFVMAMLDLGFNVISRLKANASLYYALSDEDKEQQEGKVGRPRIHGAKIDPKALDKKRVKEFTVDFKPDCKFYTCIAYKWNREIRLVIMREKNGNHYYFMSTDVNMSGKDIYLTYHSRFQLEFVFRDCKQFFGLMECQARDSMKLCSSYNISMLALNVVRILCQQNGWEYAPFKVKKLTSTYLNFFNVIDGARVHLTPQKLKDVIKVMHNLMKFKKISTETKPKVID